MQLHLENWMEYKLFIHVSAVRYLWWILIIIIIIIIIITYYYYNYAGLVHWLSIIRACWLTRSSLEMTK